jgi:Asp-tRNA(Asn)/Glu-tRNA(Gln) amidotransferase A subunit family amidase
LIVAAEAARVHAQWFALYGDCYHPKTVELIERGQAVTEEVLMKAQNGRFQLRDELSRIMNVKGIDLWIAPPATGPAPLGLESTGDPVMNLPWTHAGLPTITLPVDENEDGLPLGLQVIGRWYQDEALIAWCHELETALAA